jgi:hypothetical protein
MVVSGYQVASTSVVDSALMMPSPSTWSHHMATNNNNGFPHGSNVYRYRVSYIPYYLHRYYLSFKLRYGGRYKQRLTPRVLSNPADFPASPASQPAVKELVASIPTSTMSSSGVNVSKLHRFRHTNQRVN